MTTDASPQRLPLWFKASLTGRIWYSFLTVAVALHRHPLPEVVRRLSGPAHPARRVQPRRLGRIVFRVMWVGPFRPRCLFTALVLYRLLRRQGDNAEFVIGLPTDALDQRAHAWVEIDGVDVGPPPGSAGHAGLARYGADS